MKKLIFIFLVFAAVQVEAAKPQRAKRIIGTVVSLAALGGGAALWSKAPGAGGIMIVGGGGGLISIGLTGKGRARDCRAAYRF